jgi:hypothetical protein
MAYRGEISMTDENMQRLRDLVEDYMVPGKRAEALLQALAAEIERAEVGARLDELGVIQAMLHRPKNYENMSTLEATTWVVMQAGKIGSRCDDRITELQSKQEHK